jgi:hypothetical protein
MFTQIDVSILQIRSRGEAMSPLTFRNDSAYRWQQADWLPSRWPPRSGVLEKTVELHIAHARHKLGTHTTAQAIAAGLAIAMTET